MYMKKLTGNTFFFSIDLLMVPLSMSMLGSQELYICKHMITFMCMYQYVVYFVYVLWVFNRWSHLCIIWVLQISSGPI